MIKGTQRQMVMVRTEDSAHFEMAYFVLRAECESEKSKTSMLDEANSIVLAACADKKDSRKEKRRTRMKKVSLFVAGVLSGAGLLLGALALVFAV